MYRIRIILFCFIGLSSMKMTAQFGSSLTKTKLVFKNGKEINGEGRLANGATEVRVASGLSVHPTIVRALSKRAGAGEKFVGFEITSGWRTWYYWK